MDNFTLTKARLSHLTQGRDSLSLSLSDTDSLTEEHDSHPQSPPPSYEEYYFNGEQPIKPEDDEEDLVLDDHELVRPNPHSRDSAVTAMHDLELGNSTCISQRRRFGTSQFLHHFSEFLMQQICIVIFVILFVLLFVLPSVVLKRSEDSSPPA